MNKIARPARLITIFVFIAALITLYASALYKLQVTDSEKYVAASTSTLTTTVTTGKRGSLLDRNGVLLVSSRETYSVSVNRTQMLDSGEPNTILARLVAAAKEHGVEYNDTFPVTKTAPFEYVSSMTKEQRSRLDSYFEFFKLDPKMTATELIVWIKDHYGIDYTTSLTEAREIIGVRYELELRAIIAIPSYVFAEDVSAEFVAALKEKNIESVSINHGYVREYHTEYAAHLLGYIGPMSGDEYEKYKELDGYSLDTKIGKTGAEAAFEQYLHGTNGKVTVSRNEDGDITGVEVKEEAKAGSNVYLTIDIGLQEIAENALAQTVADINADRIAKAIEDRENAEDTEDTDDTNDTDDIDDTQDTEDELDVELAEGAAVVVLNVKTSETLALASYPTFDVSRFYEDYSKLSTDTTRPLLNRATMGTYNPGSTFKMVTAFAGLRSGKITPSTLVKDEGRYEAYNTYRPTCWVYPGSHGTLNVIGALENSCNYYFYWLGDQLGIDAITAAAGEFGLGEKTGIEIGEYKGYVASPEAKLILSDESWYAADTLIASIGQSSNLFTPVQIANYISTIANGGTVNKVTVLDKVMSQDYSETVYQNDIVALHHIVDTSGYISVLQQGMRAVASSGTAASAFSRYNIKVAAKTGTVQSDTAAINTGVFVCYAPADDPEIAIAVVVEKGGSGSAIMSVAKKILDYYFSDADSISIVVDGALIK